MRPAIVALLLSAICCLPFAAVVQGKIYNVDTLDLVDRAIVSVNTTPAQVVVSENGSYLFSIPNGSYLITAKKYAGKSVELEAEDSISVDDSGSYSLDLLLFPATDFARDNLSENALQLVDSALEEEAMAGTNASQQVNGTALQTQAAGGLAAKEQGQGTLASVAAAVLLGLAAYLLLAGKKPENRKKDADGKLPGKERKTGPVAETLVLEPEQKQALIALKKAGGHMTQKELRRALPYSEAKVSLIVTELEQMKLAKRFKRGRGNIIKLLKR